MHSSVFKLVLTVTIMVGCFDTSGVSSAPSFPKSETALHINIYMADKNSIIKTRHPRSVLGDVDGIKCLHGQFRDAQGSCRKRSRFRSSGNTRVRHRG